MKYQKIIKWVVLAVMASAIFFQQTHIQSLKKHRKEQSVVIKLQADELRELIKRKTYSFEVKLHVQDKSKYNIYGRNNKGQIIAPNTKTYELLIDSTSFLKIINQNTESK